jgi:hypothetical protein
VIIKFYIHHYYSISLFYKLFHKTTNRIYKLHNNIGSIFCEYYGNNLELIFNPIINDNEDGYHIIDFLTCINQIDIDEKLNNINCINKKPNDISHRGKIGAEYGINDIPIIKWIADILEEKSNWFIFLLRTEKSLIKYDGINYPPVADLENQIDRLKNHYIINDNVIFNNIIKNKYPNYFFCLSNTIHQWNELLSIRWFYEFKNIFEKLNQPYDLCFSMRFHKKHRVELINKLASLNNPKIYLNRVDNCINDEYKLFSKSIDSNIHFNKTNGQDFDDINSIDNINNYLDYLMRILPMAKMHILSETWDWKASEFTSNYLSEKTYGFVLAKVPFISLHPYPLEILQSILYIDKHPFFDEIKKINGNVHKFVKFVENFMKNFEINYNLCLLWINDVHNKLMFKMDNENTFLELLFNNEFKIKKITPNKNLI